MSTVKRKGVAIAVLAAALAAAACGGSRGSASQQTGMARVAAALQGVAPAQIDHVTLTIAGGALPSPRVENLTRTDATHYAGTVTALPAASGYTFRVEAFGAAGGALYRGETADVTISAGQAAQVTINLQEVDPTPGPVSRVPVIEGLSVSSATVAPGEVVHVSVTAHSPELHGLTYGWQSSCGGAFANAAQASTDWTAPATGATCQLSVRVADGTNASAITAYLVVVVQVATGGAEVTATINTYPVIVLSVEEHVVTTEPAPEGLSVGITANLYDEVSDPDGDSPDRSWTSSCGGSFTDVTVGGPPLGGVPHHLLTRFHQEDSAAQCTLTLTVSDGRGGGTTATVELGSPVVRHVLAAGDNHTCAIVDGGVQCWGLNQRGQLGNQSTSTCNGSPCSPVAVSPSGLPSGAQSIVAGGAHTCAIVDGGVWCWGNNDYGQLGNGSNGEIHEPVQAAGLETGVQAIAAGNAHTCAIANGRVWCWGLNDAGQLGDESSSACGGLPCSLSPVRVSALSSGVQAIAAGGKHTCAIANGGLLCWGSNHSGQLGDDSTETRLVPVPVSALSSGAQAIAAGGNHSCAIANGGLLCWGSNGSGQLGNNSTETRLVPVPVSGLTSGVQAIAAGGYHTCAIVNGGLQCWGFNGSGQLGSGSTSTCGMGPCSLLPVPVPDTSGAQAIALGAHHTCAIVNGGVWCRGANDYGQLGNGSFTPGGGVW